SPAVKAPPFPIRSNAPKLIPTKSARPWSPANVMRSVSGEHRNSPISDSPQPHEPSTPMDYERSQPLVPPQEQHWPKTVEYLDFEKIPVAKPKPLIKNLLDCGSPILFGGGSKTFKTWLQCDLAVSIAAGAPWLGFETTQTRVLYVNLELKEFY